MNKIKISVEGIELSATLNDSFTAKKIWQALPIEGSANTWGDEIYFSIPVNLEQATDARADVAVGDLGYWPTGKAFCIFFGPTPVSSGPQPRAASPVNVFGKVDGNVTQLRQVGYGSKVHVTRDV
jgi:hypothetical protein